MKKFYYIVGAFVTAAAIFTFFAVMLKKLRISLSIEGIDDEIEDMDDGDIELTIHDEKDDLLDDDFSLEDFDGLLEEDDIDISLGDEQ